MRTIGLMSPLQWVFICWAAFALYWLISAFRRKATKKRETSFQRLAYSLPLFVAFWMLFEPEAQLGWLKTRFVPAEATWQWFGVAVTAAGVALAIWARRHIGSNWSGIVTLKEGHELIRTGPYGSIRHPIYTGMLIGLLGTATAIGEVRGLIAVAVGWLSFYVKARREESFLSQEFGPAFDAHKHDTGMFLPKFFRSPSERV